jgi:hypothetical protein
VQISFQILVACADLGQTRENCELELVELSVVSVGICGIVG